MTTKPTATLSRFFTEQVPVTPLTDEQDIRRLASFDEAFEHWMVRRTRAAEGLASETSVLNDELSRSAAKLQEARGKLSIERVLAAEYAQLDSRMLTERDAHGLPLLFPIQLTRGSETVKAELTVTYTSQPPAAQVLLSLPAGWPVLLYRLYADLGAGMFPTRDVLQIAPGPQRRDVVLKSRLDVGFRSLIPEDARRKINRAIQLAGTENVFLIVDSTGVRPNTELQVLPRIDPVAVIVWKASVYCVVDFDTTGAEEAFALSTPPG